jgi:hypothetical protein
MLDMRLGAPFIVQTRLLWMAYRRWHNRSLRKLYNDAHPMTHLKDPPKKAAEKAAEKATQAEGTAQREKEGAAQHDKKYFLFEMPGADHAAWSISRAVGGLFARLCSSARSKTMRIRFLNPRAIPLNPHAIPRISRTCRRNPTQR